jgi:hypothetical protein
MVWKRLWEMHEVLDKGRAFYLKHAIFNAHGRRGINFKTFYQVYEGSIISHR